MAKLPTIRRISKEDIKDAPEWMDRVISSLNSFMESVYAGLNRGITFNENISCAVKEVSIAAPSTYASGTPASTPLAVFSNPLKTRPQGVIVLAIYVVDTPFDALDAAATISWTMVNEQIRITHMTGLTASTEYKLRVLVI